MNRDLDQDEIERRKAPLILRRVDDAEGGVYADGAPLFFQAHALNLEAPSRHKLDVPKAIRRWGE